MIIWDLCKKLKFDHTNKWYMHNLESVLENETHKLLWDLSYNNQQQQKKKIGRIVDFAVPSKHRVKLKESQKMDKYLNLVRELKKLRKTKVIVIPIVIGALCTVTKELVHGLEDLEVTGRVETTQTTASLISARIL